MAVKHLLSTTDTNGRRRIPTRAVVSYTTDIILKTALFIVAIVVDKTATPFAQHFSLDNVSLQYPYTAHERIPTYLLIIISGVGPVFIIATYVFVVESWIASQHKAPADPPSSQHTWLKRLWELHSGCLGLLTGQGLAFIITSTLKTIWGKPRPDLIARCIPRAHAVNGIPFGLVSKAICTQTDSSILNDGFRSFPSSHTGSAFSGLFYLSLYLATKLRIADQRGDFWISFLVLIPVLAATCVSMTRIMDARHHGFDVLFSAVLGIFCAWVAYRQYFPPISHTWKNGRAYPLRALGKPARRPPPDAPLTVDLEKSQVLQDESQPNPQAQDNCSESHSLVLDNTNDSGAAAQPPQLPTLELHHQRRLMWPSSGTSLCHRYRDCTLRPASPQPKSNSPNKISATETKTSPSSSGCAYATIKSP